jgi:hypothetical protein
MQIRQKGQTHARIERQQNIGANEMADADLLRAAGVALYGQRWQSDLARDLDVAIRSVQRWDAGTHPIPDTIWPELLELLKNRGIEIIEVRRKLRKK